MRKLALLITMAVAAFAMTATSAMAAMEVRDAATGNLCSAVVPAINKQSPPVIYGPTGNPTQGTYPGDYVSGGCTLHMVTAAPVTMVTMMGSQGQCALTYDIHVGPDGWGYVTGAFWPAGSPYVCNGPWSSQGRARVLMPGDVRPTLNGTQLYTAANSSTDFNVELYARDASNYPHLGNASLDAYVPSPGGPGYGTTSLVIDNQRLTPSVMTQGFKGGRWFASGSAGVTITHN